MRCRFVNKTLDLDWVEMGVTYSIEVRNQEEAWCVAESLAMIGVKMPLMHGFSSYGYTKVIRLRVIKSGVIAMVHGTTVNDMIGDSKCDKRVELTRALLVNKIARIKARLRSE